MNGMKEFVRNHVLKDIKLKALSLVLAVMLWVAICYIGDSKMTVSVPLAVEHLKKEFIIEKMESESVFVTIAGPISILKNLKTKDIRVALDVSGAKEGAQVFSLHRDNVAVPKGVQVESVKPDYMTVEIDKAVEKRLKVVVKLDEKVAGMYGVKSVYPQYVTVEGGEEGLKNRQTVETMPVSGDYKEKEVETDALLAVKGLSLRRIKPETVRIHLRRN